MTEQKVGAQLFVTEQALYSSTERPPVIITTLIGHLLTELDTVNGVRWETLRVIAYAEKLLDRPAVKIHATALVD